MCIAERNRPGGWKAGPSERVRQIHKGAGVTGDMDFINSIYRKGMWELKSVLCLGRGSLCFWKWGYRIIFQLGLERGGGDEICGGFKKVNFVIFVEFEEKKIFNLFVCLCWYHKKFADIYISFFLVNNKNGFTSLILHNWKHVIFTWQTDYIIIPENFT